MKLHPSTYAILHFTPWARLRSHRDRFYPLFFIALAVLAVDVWCLLRLESLYREDAGRASTGPTAESQKAPPAHTIDRQGPSGAFYGADIVGQREGQPLLNF